jgi:uncharacterized protein (TIGR01777 family)
MRALVTGGSGFIGRRLISRLERPVVLSREPERARRALGDVEAYAWEAEAGPPPAAALDGVEVIFHLAGENVGARWTDEKKRRIRASRVAGTRHLVAAIAARSSRPRLLVSASAVGYYGDRGDELLDEESPPGDDFLAQLCRDWEAEAARANELGLRVVTPRTGIVLGREGGALARMLTPFRLGVGGRLGAGDQWMPWIHIDDEVGLLLHAAEHDDVAGAMNAVAPEPVRNAAFTHALARALHRPAVLPAPAFALKLAFGEFSSSLLASARVAPRVAERTGYRFHHPTIAGALDDLLGEKPAAPRAEAAAPSEPAHP